MVDLEHGAAPALIEPQNEPQRVSVFDTKKLPHSARLSERKSCQGRMSLAVLAALRVMCRLVVLARPLPAGSMAAAISQRPPAAVGNSVEKTPSPLTTVVRPVDPM
jgi:hypothetical protein